MDPRFAPYEPSPATRPPPYGGRVRLATPSDDEAVARITVEREGGDVDDVRERVRREVDADTHPATHALFVAEEDGAVIGYGRVREVPVLAEVEEALRPPSGWYLLGLVVRHAQRRRGVGRQLTKRRLAWIAERADTAYYFVRATNQPSISLHRAFGFQEHTRRFLYPRTGLGPGDGILYRLALSP